MTYDPWLELARLRQEELRSLAAELAQGRRAQRTRQDARSVEWRPLYLRLVALVFGPP